MAKPAAPRGIRTFFIIWAGQLVSTVGSGLTSFALGVWIYQQTGSATLFAMNLLAYALPNLLVSPFAGALVDRWDRRLVMILSDTGAGLSTVLVAALYFSGRLEVWQVYLLTAMNSAFSAFQWPAYSAVTTLLVPKSQLGRAGGMVQIGEAISALASPAIAGALYVTVGIQGVVLVDFSTYLFALVTLLLVRVPQPPQTEAGTAGRGSLLQEAAYGWKYILARKGLLGMLIIFAAVNFLFSLWNPLLPPMILEMSSPQMLGYLSSVIGLGMLVGTLVMSVWGGPKRRIHGVLAFLIISGIFQMLMGVRPSLMLIAIAGFGALFTNPVINGSNQAIWQSKVAPDVQGRVFSVRRMISWSAIPLAYIVAGPLADRVFNPLMEPGGALASSLGRVIGVGPARGIGLLFIVCGLLSVLVSAGGYLYQPVRMIEDELPDVLDEESEAVVEAEGSQAAVLDVAHG